MEIESTISSLGSDFKTQETVPVISGLEGSPFTLVDQYGSVTILHYEGHADRDLRTTDLVPLLWTVMTLFYR